jgi:RND superfamily putative drug exporter
VAAGLRALEPDVASVVTYGETRSEALVSVDRHAMLMRVTLGVEASSAGGASSKEVEAAAGRAIEVLRTFDGQDGLIAVTAGDGSISKGFSEQAEKDLQKAEAIGLPIALIILAIVFGALVAAGLPILMALLSIIVAIGISALIGQAFELSAFVTNIITTMGLAVGIDYTLIVIQRVREERARGRSRDDAIIKAGGTASRAVLFSGLTVVVALAGLLIVPQSIFRSMALGAIVVVVAAVAAALTLLPAVLRLLGDNVNRLRVDRRRKAAASPNARSFWDRTSSLVMGHPVISIVASVSLLAAAAVPYFTIDLGWSGVSTLPKDSESRRAFEILNADFSAGLLQPTKIVVDSPNILDEKVAGAITRLKTELESDPRFGPATVTPNPAGNLVLIETTIDGDPNGTATLKLVRRLRSETIPAAFAGIDARVYVGGGSAIGIDNSDIISDYTVPVFVFVLGLSFIILMIVFRSIVVPLKAMLMNLLSVGAAYGLMVGVSQHGVGHKILGFQQVERIETWVPLFMFAILFGLSMDYHVFLLTRIRERFDQTHDNRASVAYGVRTTAGMITGAALIMVAVFAGFASGEMVMFQQFGFGLAVAVFIDATIIRTVLVPASMVLLGDWNWYLPSWLEWLPKVDVEGGRVHEMPAVEPSGGSTALA